MNLSTEFNPIRKWAQHKGILQHGDPKTQTLKLMEELGELAKAIIEQKPAQVKDALGDCFVVLCIIAAQNDIYLEEAINEVYYEISQREGKMINGTFVKNKL